MSIFIAGDSSDGLDSDGDGLLDDEERSLGTNPLSADTDGDGVRDGQEVTDGSDPLDSGSAIETLGTRICSEWNSFLGMSNIYEHVNLSNNDINVGLELKDLTGSVLSTANFALAAGTQFDFPVNQMAGFTPDTFGLICSTHTGNDGDVDGRMMYYRPGTNGEFEFAFAAPMTRGKLGAQFVSFNTFQPSFAPEDQNNIVANWVQVTNLENRAQNATLTFYSTDGSILSSQALTLAANQRTDIPGHQFGKSIVGLVELRPASSSARMILRNVRYLYDNANLVPSFDAAFQLAGSKGTGKNQILPLDTRNASSILELTNTTEGNITATVELRNQAGTPVEVYELPLAAKSSFHLVTDQVLGAGQRGTAIVRSATRNSVMAVVMNYSRDARNAINNMYGIAGAQPLGIVARGSYNTFIGQESEIVLLNPTSADKTANVSLRNFRGQLDLPASNFTVPAGGLATVRANDYAASDLYGVVTVNNDANSLVGWLLRKRGNQYVAPTPIRQ